MNVNFLQYIRKWLWVRMAVGLRCVKAPAHQQSRYFYDHCKHTFLRVRVLLELSCIDWSEHVTWKTCWLWRRMKQNIQRTFSKFCGHFFIVFHPTSSSKLYHNSIHTIVLLVRRIVEDDNFLEKFLGSSKSYKALRYYWRFALPSHLPPVSFVLCLLQAWSA